MNRLILGAGACLLLGGCIQLDQSLSVGSSGEASFRLAYGIEAGVLQMRETSPEEFCGEPTNIPAGIIASSETYAQGSLRICELTLSGALEDVIALINRDAPLIDDGETDVSSAAQFSLTESGGNYLYRVYLPFEVGTSEGAMPEQEQMMRRMIVAASVGRALEFMVSAPRIISTNGRILDDGTTARLSVPVAELFGGSATSVDFEVQFTL